MKRGTKRGHKRSKTTAVSKTGRKYRKSAKTGQWVEVKGYVRHAKKRDGACGKTRKAYTKHRKFLKRK